MSAAGTNRALPPGMTHIPARLDLRAGPCTRSDDDMSNRTLSFLMAAALLLAGVSNAAAQTTRPNHQYAVI